MRQLREDERDEIESIKHFVKYVNSKHDVEGWEIWAAMMKVEQLGKKYVLTEIVTEEELSELIDTDDIKEILMKLLAQFTKYLKEKEDGELPRT